MDERVKTVVGILAKYKWEAERARDWDTLPRLSPWEEISEDLKKLYSSNLGTQAREIVEALNKEESNG